MKGGIGISLILNKHLPSAREFAFCLLDGIEASVMWTTERLKVAFNLNRLQVDHVIDDARYPVTLYPAQEDAPPQDVDYPLVFQANFVLLFGQLQEGKRPHSSVEYLGWRLLPVNVRVDGVFLSDILGFVKPLDDAQIVDNAHAAPAVASPLWYQQVEAHPMRVNALITDLNELDRSALPKFVASILMIAPNINTSIKVNAVLLSDAMMTSTQLIDGLTQKLVSEVKSYFAKFGLIRTVGGFQMFGDPLSGLDSVASGVKSFFYEPYQGLVKGPAEFGRGLGHGIVGLGGGIIGGVMGTAGRTVKTIGSGLAMGAFDEQYAAERQRDMNKQHTGVASGLATGGKRFGASLLSGVTGIVTQPIQVSVALWEGLFCICGTIAALESAIPLGQAFDLFLSATGFHVCI
jgi:hypothetical protein